MLTDASILEYLVFLIIETVFYIYLAVSYQKRMHEDSWDSNVPAEKYILFAFWVCAVFYTILTATNIHTVITLTSWVHVHFLVTILNATKRSMTLGLTLLLSSGRSLSQGLILFMASYAATYIAISKYVRYRRETDPYETVFIAYIWPTLFDLLIYGYSLYKLRETIQTLEYTNQTRKLSRYMLLGKLLAFVSLFLFLKAMLVIFFNGMGPIEAELDQSAFFFTLVGIGFLWQPSPANRDFENVVEMQPADLDMEAPLFATNTEEE